MAPNEALREVEQRLAQICRMAEVPLVDVVIDTKDGEFVAMWFEQKVAVIVEADPDPTAIAAQLPLGL